MVVLASILDSGMANAQTTVNIKPEETDIHELTVAELETVSAGKGTSREGNSGHATEFLELSFETVLISSP
jgi:hypothetical protein